MNKSKSKNNYQNNNILYKTQDKPKTYLYNNIDMENPERTYNYKIMTKNKTDTNINLENINEEDQITNQTPKIYGIATRSKGRKNNQDNI